MNNTIYKYKKVCLVLFVCLITVATVCSQSEVGNKPSLAVTEFDTSKAKVSQEVGRELSDLLVAALLESNRFKIVERSNLSPVQKEQFMALNGSVDPNTGAEVGKLIGAQFLVLGTVRDFKEKEAGLGPFKVKVPGMGSKISKFNAVVKFNLRVINTTTGEIVFSKTIEKEESSLGSGDGSLYGVQMMEDYKSKAMQTALDQSIQDIVTALTEIIGSALPQNSVAIERTQSANANCSQFSGAKIPRIMVVIPEVHITRKIPDPAGETEIIKKLVGKSFFVVDQQQVNAIRDREKVLTALKNPQAAANLGAEFGADIIIIGEAFSEFATRQGNMFSTRARVEARAIQTDNARILAADGKFGSGLDIAEFVSAKTALRNAGSLWADYFITAICQTGTSNQISSTPSPNLSSPVEIMISGINYIQLKRFTDKLASIPGVQNVEKKLTGNVARVDVQFNGDAEKLADTIAETSFETLRFNIVGLSGNKIEMSIGK
jgi:curli biogenesis system outer membrane secretion channel CsgG